MPNLAALAQAWVERIAALYGAHTAMATTAPDSSAHRYTAAQFCAALAGIRNALTGDPWRPPTPAPT